MPVKSVYNFVPAPKGSEVFEPKWAEQVSHDIPFSDGESGEIELKITAETPIFIRNGHTKEDAELFRRTLEDKNFHPSVDEQKHIENYLSFSNYKGKYFIPGSSLKGMFRNVLEIMSYSEMNKNLVNNDRFSYRDLTDGSLYRDTYHSDEVRCGWLKVGSDGLWEIEDCGRPQRITYEEIDKRFHTNFKSQLTSKVFKNITDYREDAHYHIFSFKGKIERLSKNDYSYNKHKNIISKKLNSKFKIAKGKYLEIKKNTNELFNRVKLADVDYTLIFTGSPSFDKQKEFLFPEMVQKTVPLHFDPDKSKQKQKDFLFAYKDDDSNNISKDWEFWKDKLKKGERVPIFFTPEGNGVKHFGLAFMYKLPYKHSTHEIGPIKDNKINKDLVQIIFGNIGDDGLKGRVFIGNAFASGNYPVQVLSSKREILASPKASYIPFYLKQNEYMNGEYKYISYEDDPNKAQLSGYKRYPVHGSDKDFSAEFLGNYDKRQLNNQKVFSYFKPLDRGVTFLLKVRFHNLKPIEIGALLSAITFHGNEANTFHSLGATKPYGYGKVRVNIVKVCTSRGRNVDKLHYLQVFESFLKTKIPNWIESDRIHNLIAYAQGKSSYPLEYMSVKEFVSLKNETQRKEYLKPEISFSLEKPTEYREKLHSNSLPKPKIEVNNSIAEEKNAKDLKPGDMVTGEIVELGKPFCKVKLHLTNYPFSEPASLSGTKKINLKVGQIVKCELGSISPTGEYKQVKLIQ